MHATAKRAQIPGSYENYRENPFSLRWKLSTFWPGVIFPPAR